jgi:predicted dehydrogenase
MNETIDRRRLLGATVVGGLALGARLRPAGAASRAQNRIVVGVMGTGGRGASLATTFAQQPGVEVRYACDVDRGRAEKAAAAVARVGAGTSPQVVTDFRRVLEDRAVDALVVATCNHWHAPAAILGCTAGKHVYVEKPCCHNPREGELLVAAARKYDRRVQMGNQRRSWPGIIEAMAQLREGAIGRVYYAQAWYTNDRPAIGRGKSAPVPEGLDYDLWQGPAPRRPFRDNYLHYNWHWFWHWGNGELGNNGIHTLDLCRWGLGVEHPVQVTSTGGRFRFEDDQETPDVQTVALTFPGDKMIAWEGMSCNQMPPGSRPGEVVFHGERGSLSIQGGDYTIHDPTGKPVQRGSGPGGDAVHIVNFLAAVRGEGRLNSEIEEGHRSTLLCLAGNISYRVGRALQFDPKDGRIVNDAAAMKLWSREYEPGWEPRL